MLWKFLCFFLFSHSLVAKDYEYRWTSEEEGMLYYFKPGGSREEPLFGVSFKEAFYTHEEIDGFGNSIKKEKTAIRKSSSKGIHENFAKLMYGERVVQKEELSFLKLYGLLGEEVHGNRKMFHPSYKVEYCHHIEVDSRVFRVVRYGTLVIFREYNKKKGWSDEKRMLRSRMFLSGLKDNLEDHLHEILPVENPQKISIYSVDERLKDYWKKEIEEEVTKVEVEEKAFF